MRRYIPIQLEPRLDLGATPANPARNQQRVTPTPARHATANATGRSPARPDAIARVHVYDRQWRYDRGGVDALGNAIGESIASPSNDYGRWGTDNTETQRLLARYPAPAPASGGGSGAGGASGLSEPVAAGEVTRTVWDETGRATTTTSTTAQSSAEGREVLPQVVVPGKRSSATVDDGPVLSEFLTSLRIDSRVRAFTPRGLTKRDGSPVTYSFNMSTKEVYWNLGQGDKLRTIQAPYRIPTVDELKTAPGNPFAGLTDRVTDFALLSATGTVGLMTGGWAFGALRAAGYGMVASSAGAGFVGDLTTQLGDNAVNFASDGKYGRQGINGWELAGATVLGGAIGWFNRGPAITSMNAGTGARTLADNMLAESELFTNRAAGVNELAAAQPPAFSQLAPGGGLGAHELAGGHLIVKHVGQSEQTLLTRLANEPNISGSSSFYDRQTAEAAVSATLDAKQADITAWLAGNKPQLKLEYGLPDNVGISIDRGMTSAVDASNLRLILRRDPSMTTGYRIHTGFPIQ